MDNDDLPVGRILTRRETILLLGGAGLAFMTGCGGGSSSGGVSVPTATPPPTTSPNATATPTSGNTSCVVRPELTEGPYFVDEKILRSDIRTDPTTGTQQQGVPLALTFNLSRIVNGACGTLSGATIDVWQCNASGQYSDISSEGTSGQKYLRGYQITDSSGVAKFTTIWPGWYQGRAVHIHFKVRVTISGKSYEFTSQFFFNDSQTDTVFTASPYNTRGTRSTRNSNDGIYSQSGGETLLAPTGSNSAGYSASFNMAMDI